MIKTLVKKRFPSLFIFLSNVNKKRLLIENKILSKKIQKCTPEELMKMDSKLYEKFQGRELDWNNLNSYSEKMQWDKIFNIYDEKILCSDKYLVRDWVSDRIGSNYLIPIIGVYNSFDEIDFSVLPDQFVIKTNHGSGDTFIVKDKNILTSNDIKNIKKSINFSLKLDYGCNFFELHYSMIKPKIIIEKFMKSDSSDLMDYKFLCFDGIPYYCWVDVDRFSNHKRNIYDLNWNLQKWNQMDYGNTSYSLDKPNNFDEMIDVVKKLAKGFKHVRVDLYNINGKIFFGEMTFTNGSGFEHIDPIEMDFKLGELWDISPSKKNESIKKN